jgi:ribosome assembly protein 3
MAPQSKDKTRKLKRKARTEGDMIPSSSFSRACMLTTLPVSSSDSLSADEKSTSPVPQAQSRQDDKTQSSTTQTRIDDEDSLSPQPRQIQERRPIDPDKAFEDFYLKQATKEFANDIDKLRSAPDFNESHVPVLIRALRQGTACFSREERVRVGGAAGDGVLGYAGGTIEG